MAPEFNFEIVTPERIFFSGKVEMVSLKTPDGERGVLANHIPMVLAVDVGPIRITQNNKQLTAFLSGGFMEVTREKTIILADTAEWPHEIDKNRAIAAKIRAEERLHSRLNYKEYMRAQAALSRALERIKIKDIK